MTVIDLSEIDDTSSGSHFKYAGSPDVVRLIGRNLDLHTFDEIHSDTIFRDIIEELDVGGPPTR